MKPFRAFLLTLAVAAIFAGSYVHRNIQPDHSKSARRILYYVDPMHPAYKSDQPGVAPDCGMRLEPVYADGGALANPLARGPDENNSTASPMNPGTIIISPEKQQLIGVTYGTAEWNAASESLRSVGRVVQDETRIVRVHSRVDGWIEQVHADFAGAFVRKGDPLLTIYSPDMLATQQELLLALKARDIMKRSSLQDASDDSESLVRAARLRLELWDLSRAQIDEVERSGNPIRFITLYAPAGGFVVARSAFPKQRITADTELYMLADLSRVWIMADVFEADLARIRTGQPATVSLPYENNRSFSARVSYIQPQVDAATRTLKVRLEAANAGLLLKPDMFVDVTFRIQHPARLTVPSEAVLNAGLRKTVFVDNGRGMLEPRQVETGDVAGDRIEILSGLKAGERIVTSGNFLIDSESQLRPAAATGMGGHQHGGAHP